MKRSGIWKAILSFVLACALAATLAAAAAGLIVRGILPSEGAMLRAMDGHAEDQLARIYVCADSLAERWGFSADTVKGMITLEDVRRWNGEAAAWWGSLFTEEAVEAPSFTVEGLQEAVRADEGFKASTTSAERRLVARDQVAAVLEEEIDRVILPMRSSLVVKGVELASARFGPVPALLAEITKMLGLAGAVCVALAGLLLLVNRREKGKGRKWLGAGLAAGGLALAAVRVAIAALGLPGRVAEVSPVFAETVSRFIRGMGLWLVGTAVVLVVAGYLLIGLNKRKERAAA